MIDPKSLRIGNYVILDWDGQTAQLPITGINLYDGNDARVWFEEYDDFSVATIYPIPLTPEILQACGFANKGGWMGHFYETEIYDDSVRIVFEIMDDILVVYANDVRVRKIEQPTLHQIMNLWHSITGTELTVNLQNTKV